jgi:predicted tellurium resistance membrane protein TerC
MGIGLGIVLLVIGLVLVLDVVTFQVPFIDQHGLGWIFVIVGALAIVLALVMNAQRSRTKHIEERRYNGESGGYGGGYGPR